MNLINLSESAYLAMHSLALIAKSQPKRLTVKHLAEELDASQAHLAKVFQTLHKAGYVESVRGPAGGFVLKKPADSISFLDIYETMEGPANLGHCPFGKTKCAFHKCIFTQDMHRITADIYETYRKIKLSDF